MSVAVVGHVEWVEFAHVTQVPRAGEIVHVHDRWEEPAGGGAVAAVQLAKLAGECLFLTALGEGELGERAGRELGQHPGLRLHAATHARPQRRAFTYLDGAGERTITIIGERQVPLGRDRLPWDELAAVDGVYFTGGDVDALRAARAARVLVATPRALPTLRDAGVRLDALVSSAKDAGERYDPAELDPAPRWLVRTAGGTGGGWEGAEGASGHFKAASLPGPIRDSYGCGDSFAAGLTFGLARGRPIEQALELAASCGAACLTGDGPYAAQLADAGV